MGFLKIMSNKHHRMAKILKVFRQNYKPIPLFSVSKTPLQILIATVLSSRTKDTTTAKVCRQLFRQIKTPQDILEIPQKKLEKLLYPVGFYRNKAKLLKQMARIIIKKFDGKVPSNMKSLLELPGVGRKTANIALERAFHQSAIGVDVHVHRIANLLGLVHTKTPHQTEMALKQVVPKKYWREINKLFVSIGQQYRKEQLIIFLKTHHLLQDKQGK